MARVTKQKGFDYFSLDTDFFNNAKVMHIVRKFGAKGAAFLIYLYCEIYRSTGYYMVFDSNHLACLEMFGFSKNEVFQLLDHFTTYGLIVVRRLDVKSVYGDQVNFNTACGISYDICSYCEADNADPRPTPVKTYSEADNADPRPTPVADERLVLLITGYSIQEQFQKTASSQNRKFHVDYNIWLLPENETINNIKIDFDNVRFSTLEPLGAFTHKGQSPLSPEKTEYKREKPNNSDKNRKEPEQTSKNRGGLEQTAVNREKPVKTANEIEREREKEIERERESIDNSLTNTLDSLNDGSSASKTARALEGSKSSSSQKPKEPKHIYGQYKNVKLTDREVEKLRAKCAYDGMFDELVEELGSYKEMTGKTYKSDYLAICKWVFSAISEKNQNSKKTRDYYAQTPSIPENERIDSSVMGKFRERAQKKHEQQEQRS